MADAGAGCAWPPVIRPTTMTDMMATTKMTVGTMNNRALLTIPRRFTTVINSRTPSAIQTV